MNVYRSPPIANEKHVRGSLRFIPLGRAHVMYRMVNRKLKLCCPPLTLEHSGPPQVQRSRTPSLAGRSHHPEHESDSAL